MDQNQGILAGFIDLWEKITGFWPWACGILLILTGLLFLMEYGVSLTSLLNFKLRPRRGKR